MKPINCSHGLAIALVLGLTGCGSPPPPVGELTLQVEAPPGNPALAAVRLAGPGVAAVRRRLPPELSRERVDEVFYLALQAGPGQGANSPLPVLARLEWTAGTVRLVPQASLTPGLSYEAVFDGPRLAPELPRLSQTYVVPKEQRESEGQISAVHPSRPALPANLLKFYVHFSRPMAEGHVFRHARMLDAQGEPIDQAFREVELWDNDHRRLTLWINPGRTKQALGLSEALGPVLEPDRDYTLELTAGMPDIHGRKLKSGVRHAFHTLSPDRRQPDVASWRTESPGSGTRDPLTLRFGESMDHALAERSIRVLGPGGVEVPGTPAVSENGFEWQFTPAGTWTAGEHTVVAEGDLEDLAGNSLYRAFETPASSGAHPSTHPPEFRVPFIVR